MLATTVTGADTGQPPILIVHGLFGSARNWGVVARRLSANAQVLTVDMRNHGHSPRADSQTYDDMAADLARVIAAHGGRAHVVGHSMGGKAAMVLALQHSGSVERLIVADIAPVAYGHSQQKYIDAMRALDLSAVVTRADADRALSAAVPEAGVRAFLLQSLDMKEKRWRLNLDVLERFMPDILGWPDPGGRFEGPALFLSGARSDYVRPEHRETIRALFPAARFARIPEAGHWLHADRPRAFEGAVRAFLGLPPG